MPEKTHKEQAIMNPTSHSDPGDLAAFHEAIKDCKKCPLGDTRTKFVFGVGNPDADLMFVGEAPGEREDQEGVPFVGRAGKLLDDILQAIELTREDVYIANVLKCRPPNNRDPNKDEIEECEPYLLKQIELIKPKLLVALGRISATTLLRTKDSLTAMRGQIFDYHGTDMLVTYHPAALLRNPNWKRPAWEDFQKIRDLYREKRGETQ
ncbi:MAG: uracil-DNA glycosylase [Candidatus Marinimicrobia bacterium]|nr:uracil-DNA glycosylase [Candidatus Neomarinimicrobiota bacterium]MCF7850706.1 uracil-DNA glycosylase [Candidatus Neomarinimicrobiota bacterium]MCF7904907.1 uracil-DNA glycosylase [Candidatus Neomarinimicrobiota bacterium]